VAEAGPQPRLAEGGATIVRREQRDTVAQAIPGAGGLGLATRNPEFESMDDLDSPRSRHSSRTFDSDVSHHEINMAAAQVSEKGKQVKPWQLWMRRRLWNTVPYWAICLTGGVLVLMGLILGSVIGAFLTKKDKPSRDDYTGLMPSNGVGFDAVPIPTPTDLPPIPTGTYNMPINNGLLSNTCFDDPTLSKAWSCFLPPFSGLSLTVNRNVDAKDQYSFTITQNRSLTVANHYYAYGAQPPSLTSPATFTLVNDTLEPNRGPAWFKMWPYNKTVVVSESFLGPPGGDSSSPQPRGINSFNDFKRKGSAQPGEKPWVCTWPETIIEVFIYVYQNSSMSRFNPSGSFTYTSMSSTATSLRTHTKENALAGTSEVESSVTSTDSSTSSPLPSASGASTTTTKSSLPTEPPSSYSPPLDVPSLSKDIFSGQGGFDGGSGGSNNAPRRPNRRRREDESSTSDEPPSTTGYPHFRPKDGEGGHIGPPMPQHPPYPKVVKVQERRIYGAKTAQCTQYVIQQTGPAKVNRDDKGRPVKITVVETNPATGGDDMRRRRRRRSVQGGGASWEIEEHHGEEDVSLLRYRDNPAEMSKCGCLYFMT